MSDNSPRKATNITWHESSMPRADRWKRLGTRGATVWFTGLSGSGKSTIATALEVRLVDLGVFTYRLDGDNIRHGLNSNLGFSAEDRHENIRRVGEVAKLFADAGVVCLAAFISPYRSDRQLCRTIHDACGVPFLEAFVDAPLGVCETRDPKGLYKKARAGQIPTFTGISDPYEPPEAPEILVRTAELSPDESVEACIRALREREIIR